MTRGPAVTVVFQGHLATITSADEDAFLINTFGDSGIAGRWLGGFQNVNASDYSEPVGGWTWVTGEPWSYQHWTEGEPNDWGGGENWLQVWGDRSPSWNDVPDSPELAHPTGYIVEYERSSNIGGSAVNTAIWRVSCKNLTTGETKQASVSGAGLWLPRPDRVAWRSREDGDHRYGQRAVALRLREPAAIWPAGASLPEWAALPASGVKHLRPSGIGHVPRMTLS